MWSITTAASLATARKSRSPTVSRAAAIAAGRLDLLDGRAAVHVGEDLLHEVVGLGPEDPLVGLGGELQAGQDRLFGLGPETL